MRDTVFDDHSPITVTKTMTEGEAPYSGRYRPEGSLSAFNDEPMTGTWTLLIDDTVGGERVFLDAWGLNISTPSEQHVFRWSTLESGFFGRSDNVVIRMLAYPQAPADRPQAPGSYRYHNATAGPFLRPYAVATTFPFRAQGTQIRVVDGRSGKRTGDPLSGATAIHLRQGTERDAQPLTRGGNFTALSDHLGFVQSPDAIYPRDAVAAIWPVAGTQAIATHTPLRRYVVTDTVFVPPGQTVESTLSISDVRRMGALEVTVGFALTPTTSTVGLAFALVDPAGNEISLVEPVPGLAAEVRAGISPTVAMTVGIAHYNLAFSQQGATAMPLLPPGSPPMAPIALTMAPSAMKRLDALTGTMVNGDWTLRVTNPTADTEALLSWWGLNTRPVNLYYGSAPPTPVSLDMQGVITGGVQTVRITDTAPLLIFDLDVALEWDARQDDHFMRQLVSDLRRTSDFLFDWTNGQLALGTITVYHDAKLRAADYPLNPWLEADIRIFATNRLRPSAVKGGIVSEPVTDTVTLEQGGKTEDVVYHPGRVHMGAVWNRFGRSDTNLGEDWPRTLAHELGHYLLFLDDNYVGLDESGMLIPVDECPGAMADHYRDGSDMRTDYGEFHPKTGWDENKDCGATLSEQRSGRSDWETIKRWYPQLIAPGEGGSEVNPGPRIQPLGITQVQFAALPDDAGSNTLAVPYFYLLDKSGQPSTSTRDTRAILLTGDGHWLVDLGRPEGGLIQARGAKHYRDPANQDALCAYRATANEFACLPLVLGGKDELQLQTADTPLDIRVSPVSSTTVSIAAIDLETDIGPLTARFFSPDYPATLTTTLEYALDYSETVTLPVPSLRGYVVVWSGERIADTKSLAVADFSLGGNPALQYVWANAQEQVWGNTMQYVWANRTRFGAGLAYQYVWANTLQYVWSGALQYVWSGAYQYVWANAPLRSYAPAISNDGQVMIYSPSNLGAAEGELITLQSSSQPPLLPGFATLVGEPYRLTATAGMSLTDASITMSYVRGDVNTGEEGYLRVYYCDAGCSPDDADWQPLPTRRSDISNQVSAPLQGPGFYALMSSIEVPLAQGWNQIGYPLAASSAISQAVALSAGLSITDARAPLTLLPLTTTLSAVYHFEAGAGSLQEAWLVYGPVSGTGNVHSPVSTLTHFEFAQGYQIFATQPITLLLTARSGAGDDAVYDWNTVVLNSPVLQIPPAVFVADFPGSTQAPQVAIAATVARQPCTPEISVRADGTRADRYIIIVYANDPANLQCFAAGAKLGFEFKIDNQRYFAKALWDNTLIQNLKFTN